ncbi:hypothetical protein ACHAWF_006057 [Thalassiosira exigua]
MDACCCRLLLLLCARETLYLSRSVRIRRREIFASSAPSAQEVQVRWSSAYSIHLRALPSQRPSRPLPESQDAARRAPPRPPRGGVLGSRRDRRLLVLGFRRAHALQLPRGHEGENRVRQVLRAVVRKATNELRARRGEGPNSTPRRAPICRSQNADAHDIWGSLVGIFPRQTPLTPSLDRLLTSAIRSQVRSLQGARPALGRARFELRGIDESIDRRGGLHGRGGGAICEEHDVEAFPTLLWGEPSDLQTYEGKLDCDTLREFAREHLKPQCSPANIHLCDEDTKARIERYRSLGREALEFQVEVTEKEIKGVKMMFEKKRRKLEEMMEDLEMEKDEDIAEIKAGGLGLMKGVLLSMESPTEGEL